ncbi:MAG TPA: ABC transporter ATP-binding protein, partial [Planctomycetota bacterium]|nr:ABC transporter ATP-binding protein [Planctomycetota bacterium]
MNHGQPGDTIVCVEQLRKKRGKQQALDGVSFSIPRGRVLGLIGPNGAGKTTTIKILIGLLRPDSGRAEVFGTLPMELAPADRQRIGYLSESTDSELPDLPITELLEYQSHFFAAWDWQWCRQLIDRMGVAPARTLYSMSAGERRKTELLLALAHRPDLL